MHTFTKKKTESISIHLNNSRDVNWMFSVPPYTCIRYNCSYNLNKQFLWCHTNDVPNTFHFIFYQCEILLTSSIKNLLKIIEKCNIFKSTLAYNKILLNFIKINKRNNFFAESKIRKNFFFNVVQQK